MSRVERRAWKRRVKLEAWKTRRLELARARTLRIIGRYGSYLAKPNPLERLLVGERSYQELEFRVDGEMLQNTVDVYEVGW